MLFFKPVKSILFIFILLAWFLITIEITLRTLGYFYFHKPSSEEFYNYGDFNIVCIGDSFTYGFSVKTNDSYPKQLEDVLNQGNPGMHFRVYNLGMPGSNSSQHLLYLEDIFAKYKKINLVIVLTGTNDYWNFSDSNIYKFINHQKNMDLVNIRLKVFFSNFRIYKMLEIIALNLKGKTPESRGSLMGPNLKDRGNIDKGIFRHLIESNLSQMITVARSNGAGIILQNYPSSDYRCGCEGTPEQEIAGIFSVPFVNNCSIFHERLKTVSIRDLFLYDNSHPNSAGYAIMVKELYKVIVNNYLKVRHA